MAQRRRGLERLGPAHEPLANRLDMGRDLRLVRGTLGDMNLTHVTLIVSDFERSKAFYLALGLVPIVDTPPRYARFGFPGGDATLSIEVTGDPPAPSRAHVYFECADVDAEAARIAAAGLTLATMPTDMFYLWREARLLDPDGHELRLFSAGANRLDPPWRVGRASAG